jgi:hypothetical protein
MRFVVALSLSLWLGSFAFADDPQPTPAPVPAVMPAVIAGKDVTGTGKRADPFVFDQSTKCVLRLIGTAADVRWTMDDAPPDIEVIGNAMVFSLASPGEYVVFASWDDGAVVAWLKIKGPNGPPVDDLASKLKAALTGPDAKQDAAKLSGMCAAMADAIQAGKLKTMADWDVAWKLAQQTNMWPAGKYPAMPDIIRLAIPPAEETLPIPPATVPNLRVIEKTARAISNG